MPAKKKFIAAVSILIVLWIVTAFVSVFSGIYDAGIVETVTGGDSLASTIFYKIRVPRCSWRPSPGELSRYAERRSRPFSGTLSLRRLRSAFPEARRSGLLSP